MTKKKISVIALDPRAGKSYGEDIAGLFSDVADISVFSMLDGSAAGVLERADLFVASTDAYGSPEELAKHIPLDSQTMAIEVSFRWSELRKLKELPAGSKVLFVNMTETMAREAIAQLEQFGITHIHWIPFYPGASLEEDVHIAVTPDEMRYVPPKMETVIDIGQRVCTSGMMIEIALRLGLESLLEGPAFQEYARSVATSNYSFDQMFARSVRLESLFHILLESLEDGVIGMNVGDEKDLNLKFPDNYSSADLAGQEVVFHVKLNQLKSEADSKVDDDLAKRYYNDDTATLDQLKEEVRAELQAEADSQFFNAAGSELLNEVINNSEVTADPDAVDDMFNQLKSTYSSYASSYGLEFDQFLSMFLGTDEDGLRDTAENLVKQQIILNAIQAEENLSATDEQKDKLAVMNYFKNAAQMITTYGEDSAKQIFDMGAVYYYLIDNSTYVEAPETEAETTEAENILEEKETAAEESESSSAAN